MMEAPKQMVYTNFEHNSTRSCSSDNSSNTSVEETPAPRRGDFKFPEGGWECSKCQNYNFKGRKECHRCKKTKSSEDSDGMPAHMQQSALDKDALRKAMQKVAPAELSPCGFKKPSERVGDWTCQRCSNHNFAFRDVCNKCYMSHIESSKMLYSQQ